MKLRLLGWLILFAGCLAQVRAQGPTRHDFSYVAVDPAGACSNGQSNQYNYILGKEWGCNNNVWTLLASGGGGGPAGSLGAFQTYATSSTFNGTVITGVVMGNGTSVPSAATGPNILTALSTSIIPVTNGGTGTATQFTQGSVIFAGSSGVYSQNNAKFFWNNDATNPCLALGTTTCGNGLVVEWDNNTVGDVQPRGVQSVAYDNTVHSAHITGTKARGTRASPSALQVGDYILGLTAEGYDGATFPRSGNMAIWVTGVGAGIQSTAIDFSLQNSGSEQVYAALIPPFVSGSSNPRFGVGFGCPSCPAETAIGATIEAYSNGTPYFGTFIGNGGGLTIIGRQAEGTLGSLTASASGSLVGGFGAREYTGAAFATSTVGLVGIWAAQNATSSNQGTYLTFETTPLNSNSRAERLRVFSTGGMYLGGTTDPGAGVFQTSGGYKSTDGTAGASATCTILSITTFTVKNGLVTACS